MHPRNEFQELLGKLNPEWEQVVREAHGGRVKTNPDGDVSGHACLLPGQEQR